MKLAGMKTEREAPIEMRGRLRTPREIESHEKETFKNKREECPSGAISMGERGRRRER